LSFLAKNQQLSNVMLMGKQQMPPLEQLILAGLFGHQQTHPNSQWLAASTTMITCLEVDETGASVAPGEKHHSGVAVDDKARSGRNRNKCGTRQKSPQWG